MPLQGIYTKAITLLEKKKQLPIIISRGLNVPLSLITLPSLTSYTVPVSLTKRLGPTSIAFPVRQRAKFKYKGAQTKIASGSFRKCPHPNPIHGKCQLKWEASFLSGNNHTPPPPPSLFYQMSSSRAAGAPRLCQIKPDLCSPTNAGQEKTADSSLFLLTFPGRCSAY